MRARAVDTPWGPGDRLKVVATVLSGLFSLFPSIRIVFIITATCQQCLLVNEKIKTTEQKRWQERVLEVQAEKGGGSGGCRKRGLRERGNQREGWSWRGNWHGGGLIFAGGVGN